MAKKLWEKILLYVFAAVIAAGLYGTTYLLINKAIPEVNRDALLILLGVVASAFVQVVSYLYGSSKGSADKTEILHNGQS